ncbi:hypothetical protein BDR04DRAFT_1164632 [Suillus decipiens]|nr:hypothetical protein BDR04DRAFT_1164632 [Suillus decipiens]
MPPTTHTHSKSSSAKGMTLSPLKANPVIPTVTTMSSLQATVTAISLSQTDLDKIKILDCRKNNWSIWSNHMQNYLLLKHIGGYILGLVTCPDPSLDLVSMGHWDLNNLCIITALCTRSSSEENEFLHGYTNAYLTWDTLKSYHEKVGPITQILLIQQTLAVRYCHSEQLSTMSTTLHDLVQCIYAIRIPKEEDFHGRRSPSCV